MEYGVIGEHLTHSFSKEIHNLITDYVYEIKEIPKDALTDFMEKRPFKAINVTIPYKQDVIPYLTYISPQAKEIHAVNTIVNRQGELWGYNTDYYGMSALIQKLGLTLTNKKVLILGTGGTSLTARLIAKDAGASEVLRVSRTPKEEDTISYEQALTRHTNCQILINTT
ncbi:MAG: shikimate dehydrogenase, partial [Clostridia bacterium]|nr:shikimate dehydrogenase [Clostridia bacterium]